MHLIWLLGIILTFFVGVFMIYKFDDDEEFAHGFGWFLAIVMVITFIWVNIDNISSHHSIHTEMEQIQQFKETLQKDKILNIQDSTAKVNMDIGFMLEKTIEFNEQIIEWQRANKFWKSAIYIPTEVDTLKLIQ